MKTTKYPHPRLLPTFVTEAVALGYLSMNELGKSKLKIIMKKSFFLIPIITFLFLLLSSSSNAQKNVDYFCSPLYPKDTIRVGDTVTVGVPIGGAGEFTTIHKNLNDKIKKAKKGARIASLLGISTAVAGLNIGGIGGISTALQGLRVATTASTVEDILGVTEELSGTGVKSKRLIITALYKTGKGLDETIIAEAINNNSTKFSIDLNAAFATKELLPVNQ